MARALLLIPSTSYRARDFLEAANRLGVEVTVGSNHRQALQSCSPGQSIALEFEPLGEGVSQILDHAHRCRFEAILGTDDATTLLAAKASEILGLPHNKPAAVAMTRDKHRFRQALEGTRVRCPWFRLIRLQDDLAAAAETVRYPCVLKPLQLSASRGVIRADNALQFRAAARRIESILAASSTLGGFGRPDRILVEAFIPGREVALEGLMVNGHLQSLALFDKPDPLDGPFFEETIYVTPSRLPQALQRQIIAETARATTTLGLENGPIHAELRINASGVWLLEVATRTIGGLCSRTLEFSSGMSLEELILRQALGLSTDTVQRHAAASGVMMIPIPGAGRLAGIRNLEQARSTPGIVDVTISIPVGDELVPLPEGDRYLGFIFAKAQAPAEVEKALRFSHQQLRIDVEKT